MKIDIYAHLITRKVVETFQQRTGNLEIVGMRPDEGPDAAWFDIGKRIEMMEKFPGLTQVLIPTGQPLESYTRPEDAAYIARLYNEELAGVVAQYPERFLAAVACLPMNNLPAVMEEIDRAIGKLGLKGIYLQTPVDGRPLDAPEFLPIYERMAHYDLPIWIHPTRHISVPDYAGEEGSRYGVFHAFGWPYETSVAMARLVCGGVLERFPRLKFVTHHAGGMIPFFAGRLHQLNCDFGQGRLDAAALQERFRRFYNDTALYGNTPALACAHAFFGTGHLLFGTDVPYGPGLGEGFIQAAIEAVAAMDIPEEDKEAVFAGNARALLRLDG